MSIDLRQNAEERLEMGSAPFTGRAAPGLQALTLIHGLASAPETASAALKLLHELQVHQVELDLQHEQAEEDRRQLTEDLTTYSALFELAPFAYLMLEPEGRVIAVNRIAADWLAGKPDAEREWSGCSIEDLLATECRSAVRDMLAALRQGEGRQTCVVESKTGGASVHAVATAMSGARHVLMAFVPAESVPAPAEDHRHRRTGD